MKQSPLIQELEEYINMTYPASFLENMGDHAEMRRGYPEETYFRRMSQSEEAIINNILNWLTNKEEKEQ